MARWIDTRLGSAQFVRTALNKVFPDHWSFMIGELGLYCFVVLVLTGVYLTFFFDPSSNLTVYEGSYGPLPRRRDDPGLPLGARAQLRRAGRPGHAPDPPLGGPALPRRHRRAPGPGVLHRRLPPAPRAELDHRLHPADPRPRQRALRLLAARRPAVRHGAAHRLLGGAVDPADRHVGHVAAVRWRVPRARHHRAPLRAAHPDRARAHHRPPGGPPGDPRPPEAHPVRRSGPPRGQRRR